VLARRLAALVAEGVNVNDVAGRALVRPLPDDHPAAALQYRIQHAPLPVQPLWDTVTTPDRRPEAERNELHHTPGHDRGISF